ncbi:MAG: hypothetical protein NC453_12430 [Muribaculum sp.]|nr:hypothetical protein [Muribaculum sp.]
MIYVVIPIKGNDGHFPRRRAMKSPDICRSFTTVDYNPAGYGMTATAVR